MKPQTSKEYFTFLTILHSAMLMVQVMFAAVAYYLVSSGQFTGDQGLDGVFKIAAPAVVFAGFMGSKFFSQVQLKSVRQN